MIISVDKLFWQLSSGIPFLFAVLIVIFHNSRWLGFGLWTFEYWNNRRYYNVMINFYIVSRNLDHHQRSSRSTWEFFLFLFIPVFSPLSTSPPKWSKTLSKGRRILWVWLTSLWGWRLKGKNNQVTNWFNIGKASY